MTQNDPDFWTQAAQQFQASLGDGWSKALQSIQGMGAGSSQGAKAPDIAFSPDKLQTLQHQYLEEAMGLFGQGFNAPVSKDKRFADAAWAKVFAQAACVVLGKESVNVDADSLVITY